VQVLSDEDSVTIRMRASRILFGQGRAKLTGPAREVLDEVAKVLREVPCRVRVEGRTCDLSLRGGPFTSNWELSTKRATNVVLYFVREQKLSAERFAPMGYADTRPAVPNINEANRRRNRRVDIRLLDLSSPPRLAEPTPAPVSTYLRAGHSPDFLGMGLKKNLEKLSAELVGDPLLKVLGVSCRTYSGPDITAQHQQGLSQSLRS